MRLTDEEKAVRREIEDWQHADASVASQAIDWAMRPVDWAVEQVVSPDRMDQVTERIEQFLSTLSDASEWTHEADDSSGFEFLGQAAVPDGRGSHVDATPVGAEVHRDAQHPDAAIHGSD